MSSQFDDEPVSGRLNPADCIDHLLMVWAVDYIAHSPTKYTLPGKNSDVVVVDVVDLDQADHNGYQGKLYRNVWWRNGRLIATMKPRIGRPKPFLARMGVGENTMGKPPYELWLMTHDQDCMTRATAWLEANPDFRPTGTQGHNPEATRVQAEAPVARQKSQLEILAEQAAQATTEQPRRMQANRDLVDARREPLPPPPPARAAQSSSYDETPPF